MLTVETRVHEDTKMMCIMKLQLPSHEKYEASIRLRDTLGQKCQRKGALLR